MATSSALAVLFLAHFAHCLASDLTVTAVATLPQEVENWQHADFEPLEQAPLVVGNASLIPHESVAFSPRGLSNPFKKRAGNYCFSSCSSCYCSSGNDCCTNTALQSGWCCWFTLDCDTVNMKCHTPTVTQSVTATTTSIVYQTATSTQSVGATSTTIVVVSSISVVTISNIDTATSVQWVTITSTASPKQRRQILTSVAQPAWKPTQRLVTPTSGASEPAATIGTGGPREQLPILRALFPRLFGPAPQKRQAITSIYTATVVTVYVSSRVAVTAIVSYTDVVTVTSILSSVSTSVVGAKTTITVTSTTTFGITPSAQISSQASSQAPSQGSSSQAQTTATNNVATNKNTDNGGLSTGAKAGIGAGAAVGALALTAILFFLYRRRSREREKKTQEMISTAVAAATGAQSPPPNDKSAAVMSNRPSQHPHASPGSPVYPIPVPYDQDQNVVPGLEARYSSPAPEARYSSPAPQYEMSSTPVPQPWAYTHGAQRPMSGPGSGGVYGDGSNDYDYGGAHRPRFEMQVPPAEVPSMQSPRMPYAH